MWSNEAFFRYFLSLYKTLKPVIGSLLTPLRSEQLLLRGQLQLNTKGPGPTFKNKSSFGNVSWTIYDCNRNLLLIKVAETKINRYWAAIMAKCTPCRNICSVHKERNLIYFPSPSLAYFCSSSTVRWNNALTFDNDSIDTDTSLFSQTNSFYEIDNNCFFLSHHIMFPFL